MIKEMREIDLLGGTKDSRQYVLSFVRSFVRSFNFVRFRSISLNIVALASSAGFANIRHSSDVFRTHARNGGLREPYRVAIA